MRRRVVKIVFLCVTATLFACRSSNDEVREKVASSQDTAPITSPTTVNETDEQKAVRIAEHFIVINGYTTAEPDMNNLTYESIDYGIEERHNSLQPKAYGLVRKRRGTEPGWTIVFLYTKEYAGSLNSKTGRAVTMDSNFENLRVEHVDFLLKEVDVKFD